MKIYLSMQSYINFETSINTVCKLQNTLILDLYTFTGFQIISELDNSVMKRFAAVESRKVRYRFTWYLA